MSRKPTFYNQQLPRGTHSTLEPVRHTGPSAPDGKLSRRSTVLLVGTFIGIALAALVSLVRVPYVVMQPGPITNTLGVLSPGKPLISVSGAPTYPTQGQLDFTTVEVIGGPSNQPTVLDVVKAWFDPHSAVVNEDLIFPKGVSDKQVQQENIAEMTGSQENAIAVALRSLGKKVPETVSVAALPQGSPSAGLLKPGDQIVAIDGHPVGRLTDVRGDISGHRPGEKVTLVVRRQGMQVTVTVPTTGVDGHAAIGVYLRSSFHFPVDVQIHAGDVGGPSAGTMFSLGIYDKLTPGALTGGAHIAGTGTLDSDGHVGPIGGIQQKLAGARAGGAQWFLAPASNCNEVVGHVPDGLHVVRITTFTNARSAVEAIAGKHTAGLPSCTK